MTRIGERIKIVRQEKHLTQQKFGEQIGLKQNSIAIIESGKRDTSDQTLMAICREFQVSETWLRTGEGEMFDQPSSQLEQVQSWVQGIFTSGSDLERRFIVAMSRLSPKDWDMLALLIKKITDEQQQAPAPQPAAYTDEELAAYEKVKAIKEQEADPERAALHAELDAALDEKEGASAASGSSGSARKQA